MRENSNWDASAQVYAQLGSYVLVNAGANAYEGKTDFTGSMVSLGWECAQLDLGFRPHWFSPMTDSSMLMSTEAPTMPSVRLSNYAPISPFNIHYELFGASMSKSDRICPADRLISGNPRLTDCIWMPNRPAAGAIGVNRLYSMGAAHRRQLVGDLRNSFTRDAQPRSTD